MKKQAKRGQEGAMVGDKLALIPIGKKDYK